MAEVPVESPQAPPFGVGIERVNIPGADFLRGAAGMPAVRQLALLFGIAGSVAMAVVAVLWMQTPEYRPLTGITSAYQANDVAELLDSNTIPHRIDEGSGMILVPQARYYEARMLMAGSGQIGGRQIGYELLDEEQGFGVSQFMELARHRRSVEGELARSVASLDGVMSARVLLATPKSTTFLRDRRKPSASVTVRLVPGFELSNTQITGITNLVAAAVPELVPDDVAVVDQSGKLLSVAAQDEALEQSERQLRYVALVEQQLQSKVSGLLAPIVGPERFGVQVTADVDFTMAEQAEELYNPDQIALRSEQQLQEEDYVDRSAQGVPGALSNQPAEAGADPTVDLAPAPVLDELGNPIPPQEPRRRRSESTRNYEVDRTINYTQRPVGSISRLAVSVIVDNVPSVDAQTGETVTVPWTEAELETLQASVMSAVGYSAERGDVVSVVNRVFFNPEVAQLEPAPFWAERWFVDLLKQGLVGLLLLFLAIGLLRPLFRNLSQAGVAVQEKNTLALAQLHRSAQGALVTEVPGAPVSGLLPASAAGYESKVNVVRGLVEEDPGRVAQVVKHWVATDE